MKKKEKETMDKIQQRKQEAYERNKENQKLAKRKIKPKTVRRVCLSVVAAILILATGAFLFLSSGLARKTLTAATVGKDKITPAEYTYFYDAAYRDWYNAMSQYVDVSALGFDPSKPLDKQEYGQEGETYKDHFMEEAGKTIVSIHAFYQEAMEEGFEVTDEMRASMDEAYNSFKTYAESNDITLRRLLEVSYGAGMSENLLKEMIEKGTIASEYIDAKSKTFTFTDEEVEKYYSEHEQDLNVVDYRIVSFPANDNEEYGEIVTPEQAKEKAEKFMNEAKDAQAFTDKSMEQMNYDASICAKEDKETASMTTTELAEWLFASERKVGDKEVFTDEDGTAYVAYIEVLPRRDESRTRDVRHILISFDDYETEEEAKAAADAVYEEWKSGDATEDSFAALANAKSTDPGSNTTGGLYEAVEPGQMVDAFDNWLFDEARTVGDTDIVKTDYGYHIMYYVGEAENPVWMLQTKAIMEDDAYAAWYDGVTAKYPLEKNWLGMKLVDEPRISVAQEPETEEMETEGTETETEEIETDYEESDLEEVEPETEGTEVEEESSAAE